MKVIFLTAEGRHLPGARVRSYHFSEVLRKRGVDAEVLSMADDFHARDGEDLPLEGNLKRLNLVRRTINRLEKMRDLKIVSQRAKYPSLAVHFLNRSCGVQYIFDYDDWELQLENFFFLNRLPFLNRLARTSSLTERLASGAEGCVAASRRLERYLKTLNGNVRYIPTGVDSDRFRPAPSRAGNGVVNFVWSGLVWGRIIYDSIIEAARGLDDARKEGARLRLVIVGGGAWMPALLRFLQRSLPDLEVIYRDTVRWEKMPELLTEMHVGLMPMTLNESIADWVDSKSPTKMFEYMAAGLPVLASRRGEAEHILSDGDDGFLYNTVSDFKYAALTLIDDGTRARVGAAARHKVESRYSLTALADSIMEAIVGK